MRTEVTGRSRNPESAGKFSRSVKLYAAEGRSIGEFREMIGTRLFGDSFTAQVIGSEFATNAVRYGSAGEDQPSFVGGIDQLPGGGALIYVADTNAEIPITPVNPKWNAESGRGLVLVNALANRWGYTKNVPPRIRKILPGAKKVAFAVIHP